MVGGLAFPRWAVANGADLPPEIIVQGFIRVEDGHVHLLARFPLVLLSSFSLPKRGPGYLDLARINNSLKQAAFATGQQIELLEDGVPLAPTVRDARVALLSDRSFASYPTALAHFQAPPLPIDTELFWNQGFFDTQLDYTLHTTHPDISIRVNVAPELGARLRFKLEYLPNGEPARTYEIRGASGRIPLDPRWFETAWIFLTSGFVDSFALDRFVFLVCLVAPFRRFRALMAVVIVLCAMQALTLTAAAEGAVSAANAGWLQPLFDSALAAMAVLIAIGNLAAPSLRRRWCIAAIIGALGGFGLGHLLADLMQFAGTHTLVSVASFNLGIAAGELVSFAIALIALRLMFATAFGPLLAIVVLSAVLGHIAWHWMLNNAGELEHQLGHTAASSLSAALLGVALWMVPAIVIGAVGYFLPKRFDGDPAPSLLRTLLGKKLRDASA
ncbi:MAG TPA: HupE/UreJ family protein [Casimicrobiaceae bacterium]|nr:HupE/UreJ family protein [Casimicrobiaceae bacterium]